MKRKIYCQFALMLLLLPAIVLSCKKKEKLTTVPTMTSSSKLLFSATDTVVVDVSLDDSEVVQLYQNDQDLQNNCAAYQLADAMRHYMTSEILDYVYDHMTGLDSNNIAVSYQDLFAQFPGLQTNINNYISSHTYSQPYEFANYEELTATLSWDSEQLTPAIWVANLESISGEYTPSVSNYVFAIPVEIDEDDLGSQDIIYAWKTTGGTVNTVGIGEKAAKGLGTLATGKQGVFVTGGVAMKPGGYSPYTPGINTIPPFGTSNPWSSIGNAEIIRVKCNQRFDANKYSEIRLAKMTAPYSFPNPCYNVTKHGYIKDIHKNDIGSHVWISHVWLSEYLEANDDKVVVFNLYEYDWYGNSSDLGFITNRTNTLTYAQMYTIGGPRKYRNEYYLTQPEYNHQFNDDTRFAHPQCRSMYINGSINCYGDNGECMIQ